ncbi:hypothetical protein PORY_000195 [Pneumocystis oryctolagi]|uniref:Uncharacterized protein n=1 Tax=Pneumocystis oryctolagi TaxID=42067 RepID=A0ACB7CHD0_9ASCO|nr:hypothetical protein PORY_000195 [Pneumocystis oryctolagi]
MAHRLRVGCGVYAQATASEASRCTGCMRGECALAILAQRPSSQRAKPSIHRTAPTRRDELADYQHRPGALRLKGQDKQPKRRVKAGPAGHAGGPGGPDGPSEPGEPGGSGDAGDAGGVKMLSTQAAQAVQAAQAARVAEAYKTAAEQRKTASAAGKKRKRVSLRHAPCTIRFGSVLSEKWKKERTLEQNYVEMGLVAKPNKERCMYGLGGFLSEKDDSLRLRPNEAKIQRDHQGNIVEIVYGKQKEFDEMEEDVEMKDRVPKTSVIKELREKASKIIKTERKPSKNEILFLKRLIDRYGEDVDAMAKDIKLNVMQQTAADLRRRIKRLNKEKNKTGSVL